ncbi:MAG: hypothetical protein HY696_05280 [Deltaproteobacteria bacterium]|nr:hypothetical protein [Deltaproteobacteria bacterium]
MTQGWNGDTKLPDNTASASYLAEVTAGEVPAVGEAQTISFDGAEVFNCATAAEATVTVDVATMQAACADLELEYEWLNCWEIIARDDEP